MRLNDLNINEDTRLDESYAWDLKGYWITDDERVLDVDHDNGIHHGDLAVDEYIDYIDLGDVEDGEDPSDDDDVRMQAIDAAQFDGWIRVSTSNNEDVFSVDCSKPNKKSLRILYDKIRNGDDVYTKYMTPDGAELDYKKMLRWVSSQMRLTEGFERDPYTAEYKFDFDPSTVTKDEFNKMVRSLNDIVTHDPILVNGNEMENATAAGKELMRLIQPRVDAKEKEQQDQEAKWAPHRWDAKGQPYANKAEMVPIKWLKKLKGNDLRTGGKAEQNIGYNPETDDWEYGDLEALANSIKERGIQEPVMISVGLDGYAYIGEGNHRIEAAAMAGLKELPTRVWMSTELNYKRDYKQYTHDVRNDITWNPEELGAFPEEKYYQRPSQVFKSLSKMTENLNEYKLTKTSFGQAFENPSASDVTALLAKHGTLRGSYSSKDDKLWVWDAYSATHTDMYGELKDHGAALSNDPGDSNEFDFVLINQAKIDDKFSEWDRPREVSPGLWAEVYGEDMHYAMKIPVFKRLFKRFAKDTVNEETNLDEAKIQPIDPRKLIKWAETNFKKTNNMSNEEFRRHTGNSQMEQGSTFKRVNGKIVNVPPSYGKYITEISNDFAMWFKEHENELKKRGWFISVIEPTKTEMRRGEDWETNVIRLEPNYTPPAPDDQVEELYHVAPVNVRKKIERKGIIPKKSTRGVGYPARVFLANSTEAANKIKDLLKKNDVKYDREREYDIWAVSKEMLRKGTKFFTDPEFKFKGVWTYSHIPNDAIDLFAPAMAESTRKNVNESFDQPYDYKWSAQADDSWIGEFVTKDGSNIKLEFEGYKTQWRIAFDRDGSFGTTGKGDEFKIFGTILAMLDDFVSEVNPEKLFLVAEKNPDPKQKNDSRIRLYRRLIRRWSKNHGFTFKEEDQGFKTTFRMNKNNDLNEFKLPFTKSKKENEMIERHGALWKRSIKSISKMLDDPSKIMNRGVRRRYMSVLKDKMIFTESLNEYAGMKLPYGSRGAWISPKGEEHVIGSGSHENYIKRFYPQEYPDVAFSKALEDGWTRVTFPLSRGDGFGFNALKKTHVQRALKRYLSDIRSGQHRVDVEWDFNAYDLNSRGSYEVLNYERSRTFINEDKEDTLELPDLEVGDELMVGKFKNRKATIKGFKKDKNNQPVAKTNKGDQQIFKGRVKKLMPEKKLKEAGIAFLKKRVDHYKKNLKTISEGKHINEDWYNREAQKLGDSYEWFLENKRLLGEKLTDDYITQSIIDAGYEKYMSYMLDDKGYHYIVISLSFMPYKTTINIQSVGHLPKSYIGDNKKTADLVMGFANEEEASEFIVWIKLTFGDLERTDDQGIPLTYNVITEHKKIKPNKQEKEDVFGISWVK